MEVERGRRREAKNDSVQILVCRLVHPRQAPFHSWETKNVFFYYQTRLDEAAAQWRKDTNFPWHILCISLSVCCSDETPSLNAPKLCRAKGLQAKNSSALKLYFRVNAKGVYCLVALITKNQPFKSTCVYLWSLWWNWLFCSPQRASASDLASGNRLIAYCRHC